MKNTLNDLPKLLKRKHILEKLGISDHLYYKLLHKNKLPTIRIENRIYVDRDKLLDLLDSEVLNFETTQKEVVL